MERAADVNPNTNHQVSVFLDSGGKTEQCVSSGYDGCDKGLLIIPAKAN